MWPGNRDIPYHNDPVPPAHYLCITAPARPPPCGLVIETYLIITTQYHQRTTSVLLRPPAPMWPGNRDIPYHNDPVLPAHYLCITAPVRPPPCGLVIETYLIITTPYYQHTTSVLLRPSAPMWPGNRDIPYHNDPVLPAHYLCITAPARPHVAW